MLSSLGSFLHLSFYRIMYPYFRSRKAQLTTTSNCVYITLTLFLIFNSKYACVFAQTAPTPSPTNIPKPSPSPKPFRKGRLFYVSNEGYMAKLLRNDSDFIESSYTIQQHFANVEKGIVKFLLENNAPPANQSLHPCNSDGSGFKKSMSDFLTIRNLPAPDTSCITQFEGVHNPINSDNNNETEETSKQTTIIEKDLTEDDVYNAIITRADAVYANRRQLAEKILGNWSEPDVNIHYLYNTTSKKCIINHVGGIRISDKWYIFTTITNAPRRLSVPLFQRQWLNEFIHIEDDKTIAPALKFGVSERPPDTAPPDTEHITRNDTTDSLGMSRGFAGPFAFRTMYIENIPALKSAMEKIDLDIQQADDAVTPSSLAILLLPLSLNVIPLALLTDPLTITTKINLIYALMTDIVTVVPLGIKGGELIKIGYERHRSIVLRMTGAVNGSISTSASVELWGAECRAQDNVLPTGIAFLCTAILFMIIGIVLEMVGRAWVIKRQSFRYMIEPSSVNTLQSQPLSTVNGNQNTQRSPNYNLDTVGSSI